MRNERLTVAERPLIRSFNTHGPVNAAEHYVVPRNELVTDLVAQIERGTYFTIYAPRQMGKTTLLRRLVDVLSGKSGYLPVSLSFEAFESWPVADFLAEFGDWLGSEIQQQLQAISHPKLGDIQALLSQTPPVNYRGFLRFFRQLRQLAPDVKVVLVIDEFDATPQKAISQLLQTWRQIYLASEPPRGLHSVVLVGLQNIATLNLGRSSPFNIARQVELPAFTLEEVRNLLGQYTAETGQPFAPGVVDEIHNQTGGHPFLVNRLAAIVTEDIAADRTRAVTRADLGTALQRLVRERNYNYETLVRHASEYREQVLRILFGSRLKFTLNTPWVHALNLHGIVREDGQGFCEIVNPIYKRILSDYFQPLESDLQAATLVNKYDLRQHVVGNELQMDVLLSRFREFVERRGREAFKVTPMPQEATGQYLLMAYLDLLVRQVGGDLFTEVPSGAGRLDLITAYRGRRYVVETKIWRGQAAFEEGLSQLEEYLDSEGQTEGYYVIFHTRPQAYGELTHKQLEFTVQRERVTIHVYLVRLGQVFDD